MSATFKKLAVTGLVVIAHQALSCYRISIPLTRMQRAIAGQFPVERRNALVTVTLLDPVITLDEAANRVGLALTIQLAATGAIVARWRGHLDGTLEYRQQPGAFYFAHPQLRRMDTNGKPAEFRGTVRRLIETILDQLFALTPIYRLERDNVQHVLARLLLKSVTVKRDRLVVQLGLY
jgi:hypothetical protein